MWMLPTSETACAGSCFRFWSRNTIPMSGALVRLALTAAEDEAYLGLPQTRCWNVRWRKQGPVRVRVRSRGRRGSRASPAKAEVQLDLVVLRMLRLHSFRGFWRRPLEWPPMANMIFTISM